MRIVSRENIFELFSFLQDSPPLMENLDILANQKFLGDSFCQDFEKNTK